MRNQHTLTLHSHYSAPLARSAIIFIHGLDGNWLRSWGATDQPAAFQNRIARALPGADIFSLDYPSSLRGFLNCPDLTITHLASLWGTMLRNEFIARYEEIGMILHCIGGMIAAQAMRCCNIVAPMRCVWLDVPMAPPVEPVPENIGYLMKLLGVHNGDLEANRQWLSVASNLRSLSIARREPDWVDLFAPLILSCDANKARYRTTHEDLVRVPEHGPSPLFDRVESFLRPHT